MEQIRRYTYFEIRKKNKVVEIEPLTDQIEGDSFKELQSALAMAFYESNRHVKLELENVQFLSITVLEKLIKFALDLREKNRVLIFSHPAMSVRKYLERFRLTDVILIL
ncbi:STAS domain protein [Leptospira broomii serovar Hurstbridge str. 5399]|uniref:STAS domain protein n=1 Tax=Leptospira broomii serovar Hurstbridge str. 5399 TaxID=1049789 RepID=T0F5B9_9LEPT|nr:STAS domain-containing protein [Leptospira broomii]EQA46325.1 STAS domain protein [Leptospira broomii serovar Hurstbridge str. 5399]